MDPLTLAALIGGGSTFLSTLGQGLFGGQQQGREAELQKQLLLLRLTTPTWEQERRAAQWDAIRQALGMMVSHTRQSPQQVQPTVQLQQPTDAMAQALLGQQRKPRRFSFY